MRNPINNILIGAAAGAAATWLMDQITTKMYEAQPQEITDRENEARGGQTAYEIASKKIFHTEKFGNAIHWAVGISAGVLYGALRNRAPFRYGSGVVFGIAFWLLMDELATTALGLTPPPQKFPWQTHARGLAGHAVLGAAIELPYDAMDVSH